MGCRRDCGPRDEAKPGFRAPELQGDKTGNCVCVCVDKLTVPRLGWARTHMLTADPVASGGLITAEVLFQFLPRNEKGD